MLSLAGAQGKPKEDMKVLEMTLNKSDIMLDKTKLFILKLSKLYIILPFAITKIEVRMRNVVINSNPKFEAISKFIDFYLDVLEAQKAVTAKDEAKWAEKSKAETPRKKKGKS